MNSRGDENFPSRIVRILVMLIIDEVVVQVVRKVRRSDWSSILKSYGISNR